MCDQSHFERQRRWCRTSERKIGKYCNCRQSGTAAPCVHGKVLRLHRYKHPVVESKNFVTRHKTANHLSQIGNANKPGRLRAYFNDIKYKNWIFKFLIKFLHLLDIERNSPLFCSFGIPVNDGIIIDVTPTVNPQSIMCKFLIVVAINWGNIRRNLLGFTTDASVNLAPSFDVAILIKIYRCIFRINKCLLNVY